MLRKQTLVFFMLFIFTSVVSFAETTMKTDVVVIGAGASGITASVQLADLGVKVITLEKRPVAGGTGNFCEGQLGIDSPLQKKEGIKVDKNEAFNTLLEYGHWNGNPELVRAYFDKSGESIQWMMDHGVKYDAVIHSNEDDYPTWHLFTDYCANAFGGTLLKYAYDKGVNIMLETPAKELIVEKGKVVGVKAVNVDNEEISIYAKAVIIATGGYGNNTKLLGKYLKHAEDYYVRGNFGKTGDGIHMAWEAGAAEDGMGVPFAFFSTPPDPSIPYLSAMWAIGQGYDLKVNSKGERFENEMNASHWSSEVRILERQDSAYHYVIFDENMKEIIKSGGSPINKFMPYLEKIPNLDELLKDAMDKGYVFRAETLDELASATGMDKTTFNKTLSRYNQLVDKGSDDDFGKDAKYLYKVSKKPFYAVKVRPELLGTLGGVKVNSSLQAIDESGTPVERLYVIGNDAGGMYPLDYYLYLNGGSVGFAVNSARIAAEHAYKNYISTSK